MPHILYPSQFLWNRWVRTGNEISTNEFPSHCSYWNLTLNKLKSKLFILYTEFSQQCGKDYVQHGIEIKLRNDSKLYSRAYGSKGLLPNVLDSLAYWWAEFVSIRKTLSVSNLKINNDGTKHYSRDIKLRNVKILRENTLKVNVNLWGHHIRWNIQKELVLWWKLTYDECWCST